MNGEYRIGDIVLGNWELVNLLGQGSYGKVYAAHREDFGTLYKSAIKIMTIPLTRSEVESALSEGMDEQSAASYFRSFVGNMVKEFELMAELKGTNNIVNYEDHMVIPHSEGIGWDILIRMELLTSLPTYIKEHPLTRSEVIQLGIEMCKALELCQRYNIIHRDIKPENIFISEMGDFKLGDFGVARTLDKTAGELSKKGTYNYMAPEIYRDLPYGSTVDIYSLGIVLYRLLNNNRIPFLPQPPAQITYYDRENALQKRMSGEHFPNPANADGRLAEIVLKACAYDPSMRYDNPAQMRADLESILLKPSEERLIYGEKAELEYHSTSGKGKSSSEGPRHRKEITTDSVTPLFDENKAISSDDVKLKDASSRNVTLCSKCGNRNPEGSIFCIKCGNRLDAETAPIRNPSAQEKIGNKLKEKKSKAQKSVVKDAAAKRPIREKPSVPKSVEEKPVDRMDKQKKSEEKTFPEKWLNRKLPAILLSGFGLLILLVLLIVFLPKLLSAKNDSFSIPADGGDAMPSLQSPTQNAEPSPYSVDTQLPEANSHAETSPLAELDMLPDDQWSWSLENGILTISGTGKMPDYDYQNVAPWADQSDSITKVIIESGIRSIGNDAFYTCKNLAEVSIPEGIIRIGDHAFYFCTELNSVTLPESLTEIGTCSFCSTAITSIVIPKNVNSIGLDAFYSNALASFEVSEENNCYTSKDGVLYSKDMRTLIKYPGDKADSQLVIPNGVETIEQRAFYWVNDALDYLEIPETVTSIKEEAFTGAKLSWFEVSDGNAYFASKDGVLYSKDMHTLLAYPNGKGEKSFVIPDCVYTVGEHAFQSCTNLTSVKIPESVVTIEKSAFNNMIYITEFDLPASVVSIGESAFGSCQYLASIKVARGNENFAAKDGVLYSKDMQTLILYPPEKKDKSFTIPKTVVTIGKAAFSSCDNLTSVKIPESVASIMGTAFWACTSLTKVSYAGSEEEWDKIDIQYSNDPLLNAQIVFNAK